MPPIYRINEIKDRNIDELIGISRGLTADNSINQTEAEFLQDWIINHFHNKDLEKYPLNAIYDRLVEMLSDNILDNNEAIELRDILKNFTGDKPLVEQISSMSSTFPLCNPLPDIQFKDRIFCLTGAFTIGTRGVIENIIKNLGGVVKKTPTLKTNYLVVGILGSEEWMHSSFGRKIEAAVELRDVRNTGIHIVSEEHFIKFL